jgi:endonuclease I
MFRALRLFVVAALLAPALAAAQTAVFVNEIHYDNNSTDTNEAVEIAGPAGTDLTGWSIVLYNGTGGASYATYNLSGTITNTCAGFGVVSVLTPGIQNGSPDGIALVNGTTVVQFLSYEGTFVASGGPANGMTSTNIGVTEDGLGATTDSLQLKGTGTTYQDFTWNADSAATFGACNAGQTYVGGVDNPPAVASSTPANGSSNHLPAANLLVGFTEDVSVAPNWFTLSCATSGSVSGTTTGGPRNYTINPGVDLINGEACTLTILASAVTDLDAPIDPMAQDATIAFTVAPDLAPTVVQTQPAQGASAVSVAVSPVVTFSEPVTPAAGAFTLVCTSSCSHALTVSGGPTAYTLDPTTDLGYLESCTLTVVAANVPDLDGTPNNPAADTTVTFGTEQSLAGYYAPADPSSAATLRATLHTIISTGGLVKIPYTSSSTDTWDVLDLADEDPMNPNNVLDVYKNASYPKAGGGNSFYNREHRWAKSFGFPDDTATAWPYTDLHHLIVSDSAYNSARNNRYFDNCPTGCTEYPTNLTNGIGGGTGVYPGNSNWGTGERWEVWNHMKGDVARALLYMDVRYEGGTNEAGAAEPDLILTDDPQLIQVTGVNTTGAAYLGLRAVLLQWHQQDPVDEHERLRNALVQTYQHNRNPFVDHPEWAACVFQSLCGPGDPVFKDGFE